MPSSRMTTALDRIATRWAGMLTTIAKEFAPNHIKPYISSSKKAEGDGTYSITVSVRMKDNPEHKYGSMDARAQEFGSGIRASLTRAPLAHLGLITIVPRDKSMLAFHWDKADPTKHNMLPDGRVAFTSVKSPGIFPYKGEGYLGPAISELKYKGKSDLDPDIRAAILGDLNEAFKHAK